MKRSQKKRANLRVSFVIQDGPITETILNIADAMYANFIAMSAHGRSGVLRWLLCSMAAEL